MSEHETISPPLLIGRDEVARLLGVSAKTLMRAIAAGAVPPPLTMFPRRRLWRREELVMWVQGQDPAAPSPARCDAR